jgi:hypothetical protein
MITKKEIQTTKSSISVAWKFNIYKLTYNSILLNIENNDFLSFSFVLHKFPNFTKPRYTFNFLFIQDR